MDAYWGAFETADAAGYWADVGVHPSSRGYADMAARIADVLTRARS
jgi:hypothetical protein